MKKTVVSYIKCVPSNNKKSEKSDVLQFFIDGVNRAGDHGILHAEYNLIPSDVGVVQGFVHNNSSNTPHLKLRKLIIDTQIAKNKKVLLIDSNLFLYADPSNSRHYLRYSFNGVFPTTGEYFWNNPDPTRWQSISKNLNISLKDWRTTGNHILICLQRNGGWSMAGIDVMEWCNNVIEKIKQVSDRPIVVRAHPGDKKSQQYLKINHPNVSISKQPSILDDLKNCWCVITYNSSPGVVAAIEGIPIFVTDPTPKLSQAYDICNTNLNIIENPAIPDRQQWIEKMSMSHWNFDELKSGEAWAHIRKYVD